MKNTIINQRITTNLWFDRNAEEAVNFYTAIFKNSTIKGMTHYTKEGFEVHRMPEGTVMNIVFELDGQEFLALNGGPIFKFNEAISLVVNCSDQEEIDYYWDKLGSGGDPNAQICGWLKDQFGLSWQIVPTLLSDLITNKDQEKTSRVMAAMMQMKKIDVSLLEKAFAK
ncbi:VOC family protein [Pedobacter gandavensis]|uniref:VOC family protein n=1 Tax=Pedobacter gandavensis TaxID=2679963 RepID=A0ABR6ETL6_9SPHI|nr:VOC family protein [Pedobacter gandavensis]MBB2148610.1 VOC family protein [Pedobacter gandavensis]